MTSNLKATTVLSGMVVAAGMAFAPFAQAETEVLINNYLPPKHPFQTVVVAPWLEDVAAATNGAVVPKLSAAAVGPPPKNWQTVTKGVADVVVMANLFQPKRIQLPVIGEMPLSSPSGEKASTALWDTHTEFFADADEYKGAKLLGSFMLTPNVINSGTGEITSLDDLKGYKLRASPGISTNLLRELGAVPVASGPSKIFGLISKGVVDGVAVPAHGLRAFRMMPYIKSVTVVPGGLSNTSFSLLMNQDKWDSLTPEQQEQVMSVSGSFISKRTNKFDEIADANLKALLDQGGTVVQPNAAFMAAIAAHTEGLQAEWLKKANAKGVDGAAAKEFYLSQLK